MIHAVRCNHASFKEVEFRPGFNVILADRTEVSGRRDSRNGLGKSTLIEIIHFCLGAKLERAKKLGVGVLKGWSFSLELTLANQLVTVSRNTENHSKVVIDGDTTGWLIQPKLKEGQRILSVKEWTTVLGFLMFGLPSDNEDKQFQPSFRSLISYFIRRGRDAFSTPFEHYRKQLEWNKQVDNAFLLGLAWEDATDLQLLKEEQKLLNDLKKLKNTPQEGALTRILGSLGELEAMRVQAESQLRAREQELREFRVYPQYHELEQNANRLTVEIHEATNANFVTERLLSSYQSSLENETQPSPNDVVRLYEIAGVELPNLVIRRLEDVETFHYQLIENRREFLSIEIDRLRHKIEVTNNLIREKTEERASLLEVLQTHGALEEHTRIQALYLDSVANLNEINQRIEALRRIEQGKSDLRIKKERLLQRARRNRAERHIQAERAIALFNANSQELYDAPGTLIINVGDNGFQFNVDIARDGSEGIGNMKVFRYDLMLAQLWSEREPSPHLLIHDSTIFDGVDERQVALALELAARESREVVFSTFVLSIQT